MATTWKKTYSRKTRTYTYTNGEQSFDVFRTGFGGRIEWTARNDNQACGFPSLYSAVLEFMGWTDFKEWMSDRMVA